MKILYVTTILGTMNFFISQINYLKSKGHTVELACNINKEIPEKINKLDCNIYDVKFQRSPLSKDNLTAYKTIKKIVEEGKYDIVHVHTPIAAFISRLALKGNKAKVIYTAHCST